MFDCSVVLIKNFVFILKKIIKDEQRKKVERFEDNL